MTWLLFNESERAASAGSDRAGCVFLVGNTRDNSTDSRKFGGLAIDQIVGTTTRAPALP